LSDKGLPGDRGVVYSGDFHPDLDDVAEVAIFSPRIRQNMVEPEVAAAVCSGVRKNLI